eukprot:1158406-Pelagomonas_calceolata.AAC.3
MAMQFKLQSGMAQQHHDASIPEPLALVATLVWFVAALTAWSYVQASSWLYKRLGAAAMKLLGTQPHKTTHSCLRHQAHGQEMHGRPEPIWGHGNQRQRGLQQSNGMKVESHVKNHENC